MKTQLSILVKKESLFSTMFAWHPIWDRSPRSYIKVWIDSETAKPLELVPRKEPYLIDLEPGVHQLVIKDGKKKIGMDKIFKVSMVMATSALFSSLDAGADVALGMSGKKIEDGYAAFELGEGDTFKISCKATNTGVVKVKAI